MLVHDQRDRAITCLLCGDLHLTSMFSGLLQKDLFKGKWSLAKSYFKQNYCHACHIRFAVFFPLPSCCVSSLLLSNCTLFSHQLLQVHSLILIGNEYKQRLVRFIENISHNSLSLSESNILTYPSPEGSIFPPNFLRSLFKDRGRYSTLKDAPFH